MVHPVDSSLLALRSCQVGLVQQNEIGTLDLRADRVRQVPVAAQFQDRACIANDADSTHSIRLYERYRTCHSVRQRDAAALYYKMVGSGLGLKEAPEAVGQVAAVTAADAAAGYADDLFVLGFDEVSIDGQATEIVDQHSEPAAVRIAQQMVDQRRLAAAEVAAYDGDREPAGREHGESGLACREDAPALNDSPDGDVVEPGRVSFGGVLVENGEICALPALDAADLVVQPQRVRGPEGDRL